MRRACALVVVSAVAAVSTSSPARADASANETAAARALAIEGIQLADQHKCVDAIDRLTRAEYLVHAPTTLERLAECQIELGRVVLGTENLQRLLRESLPPRPPPAFVFARARAERALAAALPKISHLQISVEGEGSAHAVVTIDGDALASVLFGVDRPTDPGAHVVIANAPGFTKIELPITLSPGETRAVPIALTHDATGSAEPAKPTPPAPEPALPPATSRAGAFTAFGIGAAGLAGAAILGGMYFPLKSDRDAGRDVSSEEVSTLGGSAVGALVVAGTSIAIGIVLLATGGGAPVTSARANGVVLTF